MPDSLWHHGPQHARLLYPSLSPSICSNSCSLSQWCHPTISVSVTPFSFCPQTFIAPGSFLMSQLLNIRWANYWSFSFSSSNEYPELKSFRIDRFNLKNSQDSSPESQFKSINSSVQNLYCPTLSLSNFSSKEQVSFNLTATVTTCSDFRAQENKIFNGFHFFHFYFQ